MPSTPPSRSLRVHTPPTPLHGPQYDSYEPYSPRRSTRRTAHSNPYSSFNGERSPKQPALTTPPQTSVRKARFARAPTQLSSPPSSPASPVKRARLHKTPRKHSQKGIAVHSDSESAGPSSSLALPNIRPVAMLPTPSKTPKKRGAHAAAITSTARILSFQSNHPNDVMPSPRKMKSKAHTNSRPGFELYEDEAASGNGKAEGGAIEIFTDANARVPEVDESEDNPFVGRKVRKEPLPQRRSRGRRKGREELESESRIEEAVGRDEGVTYVFRGKKIFRRFSSPNPHDLSGPSSSPSSLTAVDTDLDQRRLKRQAGPAAQRPLTRSAIKPRLLFPSEDQLLERADGGEDDVDEEAPTDIEMEVDHSADPAVAEGLTTPVKESTFKPATPPPTKKRSSPRGGKKAPALVDVLEDGVDVTPSGLTEDMELGTDSSFTGFPDANGKGKGRSPFDSWQRTKGARKRAGEAVEEGSGKRTRGARGVGTPAT